MHGLSRPSVEVHRVEAAQPSASRCAGLRHAFSRDHEPGPSSEVTYTCAGPPYRRTKNLVDLCGHGVKELITEQADGLFPMEPSSCKWPAIKEPVASVTWSLATLPDGPDIERLNRSGTGSTRSSTSTVVRGTPRHSLYTLDTLLNLDGGVKPEMVATDIRLLPRHGLRPVQDARLPLRPALPRPGRPAVLACRPARRLGAGRRVRSTGGRGLQQGQPQAHRDALAGHAPGRRITHHQPGPGLRPAADVRPRGPPDAAGGGVRRVRADRQDHAPARRGRPGRRHPTGG